MKCNSNTTLVKVKYKFNEYFDNHYKIQIQHLLKLNQRRNITHAQKSLIQIQHLLKLNMLNCSMFSLVVFYSNTTLVKVK